MVTVMIMITIMILGAWCGDDDGGVIGDGRGVGERL